MAGLGSSLAGAYGALSRVVGGMWSRYGGWGWSRIRLFLPGARFDYEREAGDLWSNPVIALAIDWLGNRFPRPRQRVCRINRKGDWEPVGRHPLTDLWGRPNPHYGRRTLEKAIGLSLKCDGNAYLYKVRDRAGRVVELWWIPHYRILPTWPADGSKYIDGYRVWLDSAVYHLPPEDVLHIRDGIDPRNERLGLSAVKSCIREVCTVNAEAGYTAALMLNSAVPGMMVIPDSDNLRPTKDDADRIKDRLQDTFAGDGAGGTVVLAGRYKVVPAGFSPEELCLDKLPQTAQARIAAGMGTAAMSLGLPDPGKTYANLGESNRASWGTVVSIQELIAEAVRWGLLPEFGADPHVYTVDYDYSHIQELQESLDSLHSRTREDWKAGVITKNEAREQIGYEPDTAGDYYFPGTDAPASEPDGDEGDRPTATAAGTVPAGDDVQATALNGAQISSLVEIVQAIQEGTVAPESASAMIAVAFPNLTPEQIAGIVKPAAALPPPEPAAGGELGGSPSPPPPPDPSAGVE